MTQLDLTQLVLTRLDSTRLDLTRLHNKNSSHFCTIIILLHFFSLYRGLAANDYVELIWTTFAEFPGTILAFLLIDWIGRKKTLAILGFIFAASTLGIMECSASKNVLIMLLFCSRGAATGLLMVILMKY